MLPSPTASVDVIAEKEDQKMEVTITAAARSSFFVCAQIRRPSLGKLGSSAARRAISLEPPVRKKKKNEFFC